MTKGRKFERSPCFTAVTVVYGAIVAGTTLPRPGNGRMTTTTGAPVTTPARQHATPPDTHARYQSARRALGAWPSVPGQLAIPLPGEEEDMADHHYGLGADDDFDRGKNKHCYLGPKMVVGRKVDTLCGKTISPRDPRDLTDLENQRPYCWECQQKIWKQVNGSEHPHKASG